MNEKISPATSAEKSSPVRVIFINRYFYPDISATSQILYDLAARLASYGLDVHVVCSCQLYEDPKAQLPAEETVAGVRVHRVRTTRFGRGHLSGRAIDYLSFYLAAAVALLRLTRSGDVLVAKTDPPLISIVAALVAKLRDAALINWLQDIFPEVASHLDANPLPDRLDAILRAVRDRSLRGARINVVLGQRMSDYVAGRGVAADRIRVIENWADSDTVHTIPAEASRLRNKLGLQNRFVVQYSGNLGRAHEFRTFVDAAERVQGDRDIVFLIVGGGANMAQLKDEVAKRKLNNFLFLPYQPREALTDSLAAGDVHLACLLPALEGLIVPSKFYGILAAGRAGIFIGDPNGEISNVIRASGCGAVVGTGDDADLTAQLRRLKTDRTTLREMSVRARELFETRYTADRAAREWLAMLTDIRKSR
jgi:glycosyltransferase involved in cell wall biosynthesis